MKNTNSISLLFYVGGFYDGILGALFLLFGEQLFAFFGVTPPNHWGYIQFPALILITFGILFFQTATDPHKNRNLIPYGIMLKASYCLVVFGYWILFSIPTMWKPFAIIDFVFGILFYWSYVRLKQPKAEQQAA